MRTLLFGLTLATACTPTPVSAPQQDSAWSLEKELDATDSKPITPLSTEEVVPLPTVTDQSDVSAASLKAFVNKGPGFLFSHVEVVAVVENRRFVGWKIARFSPTSLRFKLKAGDTITKVNGKKIIRPNDMVEAYQQLLEAKMIVIERKGQPPVSIGIRRENDTM